MNKSLFKKTMKGLLNNISLEKQIEILNKVPDWVKEIKESLIHNKTFCNQCKTYTSDKKWKTTVKNEVYSNQCVYKDAGYGDSDEYADVIYEVTYKICPNCGELQYKNKSTLSISNRHDRYGNRC